MDTNDYTKRFGVDLFANELALKYYKFIGPKMMNALNLRRFIPPQGYLSPNTVAASLAAHVLEVAKKCSSPNKDIEITGSESSIFLQGCWQSFHRWPMYAVTPELCEAMFLTDPPADMTWGELEWPIDGATFLLPDTDQVRRELQTPRPVAITVGRIKRAPATTPMMLTDAFGMLEKRYGVTYERDIVTIMYWDKTEDCSIMHDLTARPDWSLARSYAKENHRKDSEVAWNNVDFDRMERGIKMAVNLLAYMTSGDQPPTVPTEGTPQRKASEKHGKERDALYSVRYLGLGYRHKGVPQGGHHASPRGHWRRGFYRNQRHGPGYVNRKMIFIAPVFVNPEGDAASDTAIETK